jgi:DNA polymerase
VVVPLGRHALAHFAPGARISDVHGTARPFGARVLYPMYHPAAALRGTRMRETFMADARRLGSSL